MDDEQRRRRREFIRTHHPDRGGDHEAFIAGLQSHSADDAVSAAISADADDRPAARPRVVVVADQSWPVSITTAILRRIQRRRRPPRVK